MKTLLLCLALLTLQFVSQGQTVTSNSIILEKQLVKPQNLDGSSQFFAFNNSTAKDNNFVYLVGSKKVPGCTIQVCKVEYGLNDAKIFKRFNNGKSAPVLQLFVANKKNYIGGILEDESGKKTVITDASIVESGNTIQFTVVGKDFSRGFTLETGEIIKQDKTTLVLYTDKVGIWKVIKKSSQK